MPDNRLYSADFHSFVQDHCEEDPAQLLFKFTGKVSFDLKAAVQQIKARQKFSRKLPDWTADPRVMFPGTLSLEQCSSQDTARYKTAFSSGKRMIDLCGGLGVDSFYVSQNFIHATYCELDPTLFQIARHNLEQLAPGKFDFHHGDGLKVLRQSPHPYDLILADPDRRGSENQKLVQLQHCKPNLVDAWPLLKEKGNRILIKASPMLDLAQLWDAIPDIQHIRIVSVKNEVKELLLHWEKGAENPSRKIDVVDLGSSFPEFSLNPAEEKAANCPQGEVARYLIEPSSGILKAGAFSLFGARFGLKKLEKNSHLYTCSHLPTNIPGRVFEVIQSIHQPKKELKKLFPSGKVHVISRNHAWTAPEIKQRFGLRDGGDQYLLASKTPSGYGMWRCGLLSSGTTPPGRT